MNNRSLSFVYTFIALLLNAGVSWADRGANASDYVWDSRDVRHQIRYHCVDDYLFPFLGQGPRFNSVIDLVCEGDVVGDFSCHDGAKISHSDSLTDRADPSNPSGECVKTGEHTIKGDLTSVQRECTEAAANAAWNQVNCPSECPIMVIEKPFAEFDVVDVKGEGFKFCTDYSIYFECRREAGVIGPRQKVYDGGGNTNFIEWTRKVDRIKEHIEKALSGAGPASNPGAGDTRR